MALRPAVGRPGEFDGNLNEHWTIGPKVHGGVILGLMDKIAYTASATHARTYCVTASVDRVDFLSPVDVGDLLTLYASINYVQRSSMEVGIRVESENFRRGWTRHTNTSYFTMVAMDDQGATVAVRGLILETRADLRRFVEGRLRRQQQRSHGETIQKLLGEYLTGNGSLPADLKEILSRPALDSTAIRNLTISAVLSKFMSGADGVTREKLQKLIDRAKDMGLE